MRTAIVLAGGRSSRMGFPKALLTIHGQTFLASILSTLNDVGCRHLVVVTGAHHDDINASMLRDADLATTLAKLDDGAWSIVRNPAVDGDQLSSLRAGLGALDALCASANGRVTPAGSMSTDQTWLEAQSSSKAPTSDEPVLVWLVDHPLVTRATVERLYLEAEASLAPVVRPRVRGRCGHPTVFAGMALDQLRRGILPDGAKTVVRSYVDRQRLVDVDDEGALADIDTPAAYRAVAGSDPARLTAVL